MEEQMVGMTEHSLIKGFMNFIQHYSFLEIGEEPPLLCENRWGPPRLLPWLARFSLISPLCTLGFVSCDAHPGTYACATLVCLWHLSNPNWCYPLILFLLLSSPGSSSSSQILFIWLKLIHHFTFIFLKASTTRPLNFYCVHSYTVQIPTTAHATCMPLLLDVSLLLLNSKSYKRMTTSFVFSIWFCSIEGNWKVESIDKNCI